MLSRITARRRLPSWPRLAGDGCRLRRPAIVRIWRLILGWSNCARRPCGGTRRRLRPRRRPRPPRLCPSAWCSGTGRPSAASRRCSTRSSARPLRLCRRAIWKRRRTTSRRLFSFEFDSRLRVANSKFAFIICNYNTYLLDNYTLYIPI